MRSFRLNKWYTVWTTIRALFTVGILRFLIYYYGGNNSRRFDITNYGRFILTLNAPNPSNGYSAPLFNFTFVDNNFELVSFFSFKGSANKIRDHITVASMNIMENYNIFNALK